MRILQIFLAFFFLTSCASLQVPEFRGGENFKLGKIDGQQIDLTAGAKVYNGNWFAVKIKPSDLNVYIDGEYLGKLHLNKKMKLKAKRESVVQADLTAVLDQGALFKSMKYISRDKLEVRLTGNIKGGIWLFSKKIEVDESRTMNGANLKLSL